MHLGTQVQTPDPDSPSVLELHAVSHQHSHRPLCTRPLTSDTHRRIHTSQPSLHTSSDAAGYLFVSSKGSHSCPIMSHSDTYPPHTCAHASSPRMFPSVLSVFKHNSHRNPGPSCFPSPILHLQVKLPVTLVYLRPCCPSSAPPPCSSLYLPSPVCQHEPPLLPVRSIS